MDLSTKAAHLQTQIDVQLTLAALATIDKIRAMHQDLEKLYRAQLVAVLLAEKLDQPTVIAEAAPRPFPTHLAATAAAKQHAGA